MNKSQILLSAILALLCTAASASEVTLPNEFVAGERARAGEVNENFEAVKTAVDDNHNRITELESQIKETGAVSIPVQSFDETAGGVCDFRRTQGYGYFDTPEGTTCLIGAGLNLPDGATITGGGCILYDNIPPGNIQLSLIRTDISIVPNMITVFSSTPTSDEPILAQAVNITLNSAPANAVVNNLLYAYSITAIFDTAGLEDSFDNLRLHNCTVTYTLGD
jgi:hypothetical protein